MASFHIFYSCVILVYSICHTGFLLHLGRLQPCNILQRNFSNFSMKILALLFAKCLQGLHFSLFCSHVGHSSGCKLGSYFQWYCCFPNCSLSCNFPKAIFKTRTNQIFPDLFLYSNFNRSFIYMQHCYIRVQMMYRSKFVASGLTNFPNVVS